MEYSINVMSTDPVAPSKGKRMEEFLRRLKAAEACIDEGGAFALVGSTLTAVEDELTNIPNQPDAWKNDGRMYPPQPDAERPSPLSGVRRFRSRKHYTDIGCNGAIRITDLEGRSILIDKPGRNGLKVDQL